MRRERTATALAGLLLACALLTAPAATMGEEEGEGGQLIEPPLYITFVTPVNNSAQAHPDVHCVINAGGATAAFYLDDFANGTLVNATADETGIRPNATAADAPSYYMSQVFEHPPGAQYEWTEPLDILMSGTGTANVLPLNISVRLGHRGADRNWTEWFEVGLGGTFDAIDAADPTLVDLPAIQYRVEFTEPTNASTPRVTLVELWYLSPAEFVYARLGTSGPWVELGAGEGEYHFNETLAPGPNTVQARVVDRAGREVVATRVVALDTVAPTVSEAPADGSVIPADQAAEISFSEAVDVASAETAITIESPFPVDRVWSADGKRLFLSAAGAPGKGQVKVTIGPSLVDRAGNRFNNTQSWTYTMGSEAAPAELPAMLIGLLVAGAALAAVAFWHSGRLREQRRAYARQVAARQAEVDAAAKSEGPANDDPEPAEDRR